MPRSTVHKAFILLSCTFLGLVCGTLYLYSSYSPQLAQRLHYLATNASTIALVGSLGVATTGPLAGMVVDRKGYTAPLLVGGVFIVAGYYGLRHQYDAAYLDVLFLCVCLFVVGAGSTFINLLCFKCCAVTFPGIRGVATSLPLALYGLSAMFYSVVASAFFPGDTLGLLTLLLYSVAVVFTVCSPLIMLCDRHPKTVGMGRTIRMGSAVELSSLHAATEQPFAHAPASNEVHGLALLRSLPFWLLFAITGSLASLGQMYIYLVGYMVKALIVHNYQEMAEAAKIAAGAAADTVGKRDVAADLEAVAVLIQSQQQKQVGLISVANCVGRLMAGLMGDMISQAFHRPRAWLLFAPAAGSLMIQLMGQVMLSHKMLALMLTLLGFFYGFTLCIMPVIVGDVFGIDNLMGNWGLVGLAPVVPSFYLTSYFGKVFDSNSEITDAGTYMCMLGSHCYNLVFRLSTVVAVFAVFAVAMFNFSERRQRKTHL